MMKSKKNQYSKEEFSDQEVYNEIKDEMREIRERNLKQVDEEMQIMQLYSERKKEKKRKRMLASDGLKREKVRGQEEAGLGEDDEEQGEIHEKSGVNEMRNEAEYEGIPTIREIGDHIRPITLTRNKVCGMLKSRKFDEIIRGCFVRYKAETAGPNANAYLLAQIVGVAQSQKQYFPNKSVRTKVLLKLQQSSEVVITLTIDHLSNQHPPGVLEIEKWLQTNRHKIPRQKQLKDKKEELDNYMFGKMSSQQIDRNIYQQAKRAASGSEEVKTDISKLIYFMNGHLHDLNVNLEQIESQADKHDQFVRKSKEKQECEQIVEILRKKRAEFFENQRLKQKQQKQRSARKKYSELFFEDRKDDKINDKNKQWVSQLYSHEGAAEILKQVQQAHKSFQIDVQL